MTADLVGEFFSRAQELHLLELLAAKAANAVIVHDERYGAFLQRQFAGAELRLSRLEQFLGEALPEGAQVFLCLAPPRGDAIAATRAKCLQHHASCHELISDVFYPLSFGRNVFAFAGAEPPVPPAHKYAVICTPRCGSTYLCDILRASGLGNPQEHWRDPVVFLSENAELFGFQLAHWLESLERHTSVDGVFGTKLVSQFLFPVLEAAAPAVRQRVLARLRAYRLVYLVRESKVAQAVSQYIASELGVWHVELGDDRKQAEYAAAKAALPYAFGKIWWYYEKIAKEEIATFRFIRDNRFDVLRVDYAALTENPAGVIDAVAAHVGVAARRSDLASTWVRTSDATNDAWCARFRAEAAGRIASIYEPAASWVFSEVAGPGNRPE